jgi:polyhydroxyalkanoate synthase subunit PhaC
MNVKNGVTHSEKGVSFDVFAEQQRFLRRMLSVPNVIEMAWNTQVGGTPHDVVYKRRTLRLLRYRRETPAAYAEPLLFCYALVNRPYILDLQPEKSVVRRYLEQGFDVYMIDWGVPSYADHTLTLDDYVREFLADVVQFILHEHRREDLQLLGYCMGGTLSTMFTALHPKKVKTLTLLASPIDFSGRESLLSCWTERQIFDVDALIETFGNCPAWFLQACFLYMRPVQNLLEKHVAFYEQMDDPRMVSNYFALERWINDNIPVAGETFREFVKHFYQNNELIRGEFRLGSRRIELRMIKCPLLLLTAKHDHLVPPLSTLGIRPHVNSRDVKSIMVDGGHVGLVVGSKAQGTLWPEATRWLADHSTKTAARPTKIAISRRGRNGRTHKKKHER